MLNKINEKIKQQYLHWFRPSSSDLIIFSQQMKTLLKSGITLIRAFRVVGETTKNSTLRHALKEIVSDLESGQTLGQVLMHYPLIFSPFMISLIEIGEKNKRLEDAFSQIKQHIELEFTTSREIKIALRYPFLIVMTVLIVLGIIAWVVVPSIKHFWGVLEGLPFPTKMLVNFSDMIIIHEKILIYSITLFGVGFFLLCQCSKGKWIWSYLRLKIPFLGDIIQKAMFARFCRTFSLAAKTNIPKPDALKVVSQAVNDPYLAQKIMQMQQNLEKGETLYYAAKNINLFPPLMLQMLMIAEEIGKEEKIMQDVALHYEKDVDYEIKRLVEFLEPTLIIIISFMLFILALGIFLPMWDISTLDFKSGN